MRTQSSDTSPEAERVQIDLLRKAGEAGRFKMTLELMQDAINQSRQDIRSRYSDASEEELGLLFVEFNYGKELADRVRAYLAKGE